MRSLLYGRQLLEKELPEDIHKKLLHCSNLTKESGFIEEKGKWKCRRCSHEIHRKETSYCGCGQECSYCTNCIQMGKVKRCSTFYSIKEPNQFTINEKKPLKWEGSLSEQQASASQDIIKAIYQNKTRLLWAVAGAGKTEMLFLGIEQALLSNKRVCIASPRVDVCLELAPRLQAAFPNVPLAVLYGEMEEAYRYTQLVLATTHQLYRFKEAFDVLVIDEIDAFPFHRNEALLFAAHKSRKQESSLIYLSATPDRTMQNSLKTKKLEVTILPARYHGFPLAVPKGKWCGEWKMNLIKKPKITKPIKHMQNLLASGKRFLVFVPNIDWMKRWEQVLKELFKGKKFESVYSSDKLRKEKVLKMRNGELDFLITTTILERGVTFPNIDVLVIGAEDRTFTESALVQISGRVGRSPKFPTGEVTFYHNGWTKEMKRAIKQIKMMNRLAVKRHLLNEGVQTK